MTKSKFPAFKAFPPDVDFFKRNTMTTEQDTQANQELADYLAKELGGSTGHVGPCWFTIVLVASERAGHEAQKGYHVTTGNRSDAKQWTISCCWPRDNEGQVHTADNCPKINVSKNRGREVLAAEIRRRLQSDYDALHAEVMNTVDRWNESYAANDAAIEKIVKQHDGRASTHSKGNISLGEDYGYPTVRVNSGGSVSIDATSLPIETALKVLEVLRDNPT